jgi:hypothetical protein
MQRSHWLLIVAASALVASAGCKKSGGSADGGATGAAMGLEAAGNDAAVVALAKKALTCKWNDYGFAYDCADMKAWNESELFKDGKNDATLVNLIEDAKEQVRFLGARKLASNGETYKRDKALAGRVIGAAERETSKAVANDLGSAVGGIKTDVTGLGEQAKGVFAKTKLQAVKTSLLGRLLFTNGPAFYDWTKSIAKSDPDPVVRKAAISAFWTGTPHDKYDDACSMWLGFASDKNDDVAGEAAYMAAFFPMDGGCKKQWNPLLDLLDAKAKGGGVKNSQQASALYYFYKQKDASAAQKARALAIAKSLAENKANSGSARGRAIEMVVEDDPRGGKAFAGKFVNDADFYVKSRAADLVKGKR